MEITSQLMNLNDFTVLCFCRLKFLNNPQNPLIKTLILTIFSCLPQSVSPTSFPVPTSAVLQCPIAVTDLTTAAAWRTVTNRTVAGYLCVSTRVLKTGVRNRGALQSERWII